MMAEELAVLRVACRGAVDPAPSELENPGGAVDMAAFGRGEKGGIQLGGKRVLRGADARLDGQPHRAIGGRHQCRAVDDAAGPLEQRLVRQLGDAGLLPFSYNPEAIGADEL